MRKYILFVCLLHLAIAYDVTDVDIFDEHMKNGDENEMVKIEFKTLDGREDIKMMAKLRIHLNEGIVHVNGQPVEHNIVNAIRMSVSIVETEDDIEIEERLAPAMFRILVREEPSENGEMRLITEVEFLKVDQYDVEQIDIKQIVWNGSNRLPVISISREESYIRQSPVETDRDVFVDREHNRHGRHGKHGKHGKHHRRHSCWFHRLTRRAKIIVIVTAALCLIALFVLTIICWRRRRANRKNVVVEAPTTEVEVQTEKKEVEKDFPANEGVFHMEVNEGYVGDKVDLIKE